MTKPKLLLCLPDYPFPARRNGFSIRYYPIIEHFSREFDIDMFVISEWAAGEEDLSLARPFCTKIEIYRRQKVAVNPLYKLYCRLRALIPGAKPFDFVYYDQPLIDDFFVRHFTAAHYDLVVSASLTMSHLVRKFARFSRLSIDAIDSAYALKFRAANNLLEKYDAWQIRAWERKTIAAADAASYISPLDKALGCGDGSEFNNVFVIPNGVYLSDVVAETVSFAGPSVGYLGHMGYTPNIRAAKRLHVLFKQAQKKIPNLFLVIIGRDPSPEILALADDPQVLVTGTVENIWPYVQGVDLFVFPMETGSGQQNKLLEAMAVGKPVISTTLGNSGVRAVHRESVVLADTDEELRDALIEFMLAPEKRSGLGMSGKEFVIRTYAWPSVFRQLNETLFRTVK